MNEQKEHITLTDVMLALVLIALLSNVAMLFLNYREEAKDNVKAVVITTMEAKPAVAEVSSDKDFVQEKPMPVEVKPEIKPEPAKPVVKLAAKPTPKPVVKPDPVVTAISGTVKKKVEEKAVGALFDSLTSFGND